MKIFDVCSKKIQIFSVTAASVLIAFALIFIVPFNKSIEFTGGSVFEITVDNTYINKFEQFQKANPHAHISKITNDRYIVKTLNSQDFETISQEISQFSTIKTSSVVAPSMTSSLVKKSFYAVFFSILIIFCYLFIRFNLYYGLGAITTIIHDIILSIAFIKVMDIELGISTIAALLTITGYSVNDTVIVYDKIRSSLTFKCNFQERINQAINMTLPRTLGTSLATILAITPIIILTTGEIKHFCTIVVFGIVIGTISSITVSSLFLVPFQNRILAILKLREQL